MNLISLATFCLLVASQALSQNWVTHVPASDGLFTSQLILSNPGETETSLSVNLYDPAGQEIKQLAYVLAPFETQRILQPQLAAENLSHLSVSQEGDCQVYLAYQAKSGGPAALVQATSHPVQAWRMIVGDNTANWDGIAILNLGAHSTPLLLREFNDHGDIVMQRQISSALAPLAKTLHVIDGVNPGSIVDIVADQPVVVIGLSGDHGNRLLWSNPVAAYAPPIASVTYELVDYFENATFDAPIDVQFAAGLPNLAYVAQQNGDIRRVDLTEQSSSSSYLNLSSRVTHQGEMGLLGLALHPNFASNGQIFVNYVSENNGPRRSIIARFRELEGSVDSGTQEVLLEVDQPFSNHNGGQIVFGPDGYLYIALGDGGSGGDPFGHGQNRTTLLGSILRIDIDKPDPELPYGIPSDNPFLPLDDGSRFEIFAYGVRNPWRISFDRASDSPNLWVADVGQDRFEEINLVSIGDNLGWNISEAYACFEPVNCSLDGITLPVYSYDRSQGDRSVTGGFVYRGSQVPSLAGRYIFGDFISGRIWALHLAENGETTRSQIAQIAPNSLASFAEDPNGEILVCSFSGRILKLQWHLAN